MNQHNSALSEFFWNFFFRGRGNYFFGKNRKNVIFFSFFARIVRFNNLTQISPYKAQNLIFSGKMTILSYKTTFGPTFSAILENLLEPFFAKSQKLRFWPKMSIFWHVWPNSGKMRIFLKKRALLSFYPYCSLNFMPSFGKSLERFPR